MEPHKGCRGPTGLAQAYPNSASYRRFGLTKLQERPEYKTTERAAITFVFPASLPTQKRLCPPKTRQAEPLRSI